MLRCAICYKSLEKSRETPFCLQGCILESFPPQAPRRQAGPARPEGGGFEKHGRWKKIWGKMGLEMATEKTRILQTTCSEPRKWSERLSSASRRANFEGNREPRGPSAITETGPPTTRTTERPAIAAKTSTRRRTSQVSLRRNLAGHGFEGFSDDKKGVFNKAGGGALTGAKKEKFAERQRTKPSCCYSVFGEILSFEPLKAAWSEDCVIRKIADQQDLQLWWGVTLRRGLGVHFARKFH